jgi:hypothetical protein
MEVIRGGIVKIDLNLIVIEMGAVDCSKLQCS